MASADFIAGLFERYPEELVTSTDWRELKVGTEIATWMDRQRNEDLLTIYNGVGEYIARAFHDRTYPFWFCDWIANHFYDDLLERHQSVRGWPSLFDSVYLAFDAGEWDHRGTTSDPVRDHTVPRINEILSKLESH